MHERLWKQLENAVSVWIVNGRLVRSVFDIDFTAGGHDHVYEFVPRGEVWIDDAIVEKERGFVLLHELHERNRWSRVCPTARRTRAPAAWSSAAAITRTNSTTPSPPKVGAKEKMACEKASF